MQQFSEWPMIKGISAQDGVSTLWNTGVDCRYNLSVETWLRVQSKLHSTRDFIYLQYPGSVSNNAAALVFQSKPMRVRQRTQMGQFPSVQSSGIKPTQ